METIDFASKVTKKHSVIPLLIQVEGGGQCGIEYKDGEYCIFGEEYIDDGVKVLFSEMIRLMKDDKEYLGFLEHRHDKKVRELDE